MEKIKNKLPAIIFAIIFLVILAVFIGKYSSLNLSKGSEYKDVFSDDITNSSYKVGGETITFRAGQYSNRQTHASSTIIQSAIGDINHDGARDGLTIISTANASSSDALNVIFKKGGIILTKPLVVPVPKDQTIKNIRKVAIDQKGIITLELAISGATLPISTTHQYKFSHDDLVLVK